MDAHTFEIGLIHAKRDPINKKKFLIRCVLLESFIVMMSYLLCLNPDHPPEVGYDLCKSRVHKETAMYMYTDMLFV